MSKKKENTKTNKKKINIKKFVCILLPCLIAIVLLILSFTIKNNNERAGEKVVTINEMVGKTVNGKVVKVQDIKTTHDFYLSNKNREVER